MATKTKDAKNGKTAEYDYDANYRRLPQIKKLLVPNWRGLTPGNIRLAKLYNEECRVLRDLLNEKFRNSLTPEQEKLRWTIFEIDMADDMLRLGNTLECLAEHLDMASEYCKDMHGLSKRATAQVLGAALPVDRK